MKRIIITIVGILLCVGITYGIIRFLEKNKPEAEKKETVEAAPVVEVVTVSLANVPVPITSEGVVATRRETIISAQVEIGKRSVVDVLLQALCSVSLTLKALRPE